jgi:cobalt/nickel transport system ATP-binding protein
MPDSQILNIRDLHFGYQNGDEVFRGLNFILQRTERVGLVGPNGAGKTTLLHLIMGLQRPSSGSIEIFDRLRKTERDFDEVRQRIGFLFQESDDQLFCPTVEEDIAFGPLNLGKSHDEARIIVKETCEKLGLGGYEKRITHRLSGGEKRLVALATVVAMHPECYLLDEPTAGLDEATTRRFLDYLKQYTETYIIITHNHEVLKEAVDKVYAVNGGSLQPVG